MATDIDEETSPLSYLLGIIVFLLLAYAGITYYRSQQGEDPAITSTTAAYPVR